ncbi:MAG TPA: HdeD family acid-resistance protein [Candidatus Binatia bacterium]|nr:HdeD family acid-resistance protein [Candidatus Binatia bacterium]
MIEQLAAHWWIPVVRGAFAIVFGLVALFWPGETLLVLIAIFGAFAFVDGIFAIVSAIRYATHHERWGVLLLEGILGIFIGLLTFAAPAAIALFFLYFVAGWAIITGIFEIIAAFRIRQSVGSEIFMIIAGILSIGLGLAFFVFPSAGLIAWIWLIGIYAVFFGALMISFGLRMRSLKPTPA